MPKRRLNEKSTNSRVGPCCIRTTRCACLFVTFAIYFASAAAHNLPAHVKLANIELSVLIMCAAKDVVRSVLWRVQEIRASTVCKVRILHGRSATHTLRCGCVVDKSTSELDFVGTICHIVEIPVQACIKGKYPLSKQSDTARWACGIQHPDGCMTLSLPRDERSNAQGGRAPRRAEPAARSALLIPRAGALRQGSCKC
eukprot:6205201-Pleurochrysis_carterae.AAC.2